MKSRAPKPARRVTTRRAVRLSVAGVLMTLGAWTIGAPAAARIVPAVAVIVAAPVTGAAPVNGTAPVTGAPPVTGAAPAPIRVRAVPAPLVRVPSNTAPAARNHPATGLVRIPPVPVPVPIGIALPRSPPITNTTSSTLFSARVAIARAALIDPYVAQTASFQYVQAVQQYEIGNIAGANAGAIAALATASQAQVRAITPAPLPTAALVSAPAQVPGLAGGLYGGDAPAIDAASFIALARGTIDDCAARRDGRLAQARASFARAQNDFAARNWQATRVDAKAAIDACAKAQP